MPGDDNGAGNRRDQRVPVTLVVEYGDASDLIEDYTANLSAGGTFVHTERELEQGTLVDLVLSFPGLLRPIQLAGVVRWASSGSSENGVGLEFIGQDTLSRARLQSVIDAITRKDPRFVGRFIRVLLAEDNVHIARMVRRGLTQGGRRRLFGEHILFDFTEVHEGRDAMEALDTAKFDVAIVDLFLSMPDGFTVIRRIRESAGHAGVAVIALSDNGINARERAADAGCDYYLDKPFRLTQLLEVARDLLIKLPAALQSRT